MTAVAPLTHDRVVVEHIPLVQVQRYQLKISQQFIVALSCAIARYSYRLRVYTSVTRGNSSKLISVGSCGFHPQGSPETLQFFDTDFHTMGLNDTGIGKKRRKIFYQDIVISERIEDRPIVTMENQQTATYGLSIGTNFDDFEQTQSLMCRSYLLSAARR